MEEKLQLQFIDSVRVMTSSLSNYVNNLFEGIHKIWCKFRHNWGIKYKILQLSS